VLHRVGFLPLISGGLFVAALGTLVAALSVHTLAVFLTAMLFVGAGIGAVGGVASTAIVGSAPPHREGMAASVEEISFELGALTGVALLGTLMSAIRARYDAPTTHPLTAYDMAYSTVLTIAAGILLASAIACAWLFRDNPKSPAR
ncbi:MFS transporter, partial [Corynebacterium sanguinis]|nr:hypothetical protein [Corynebacterium sanguinis]